MKFLNLLVGQQLWQNGKITYMRKKGNQQMTKTPMMMPSVRAALRSFDSEIFCFSSMNWLTVLGFFCNDVAAVAPDDDCGGVSFSDVCSSAWVIQTWKIELINSYTIFVIIIETRTRKLIKQQVKRKFQLYINLINQIKVI